MGETGKIAYRIVVTGHVQGVGFRAFTVSLARKNGVSGFVRNDDDGCVEIIAEANRRSMDRFLEGLQDGNGWSRTDTITHDPINPAGMTGFEVEY